MLSNGINRVRSDKVSSSLVNNRLSLQVKASIVMDWLKMFVLFGGSLVVLVTGK